MLPEVNVAVLTAPGHVDYLADHVRSYHVTSHATVLSRSLVPSRTPLVLCAEVRLVSRARFLGINTFSRLEFEMANQSAAKGRNRNT